MSSYLTSELIVLRKRQTSVEVLRVQVLEELRAKVVKLEAEVKAGRWESEDQYFFSFPLIVFVTTNLGLFVFRVNRFLNLTMP